MDLIITDLAVFHVDRGHGLTLIELAPEVSLEEVAAKTAAKFTVSPDLKTVSVV
jgi:3-oxoacid CoA-transferase subunit B